MNESPAKSKALRELRNPFLSRADVATCRVGRLRRKPARYPPSLSNGRSLDNNHTTSIYKVAIVDPEALKNMLGNSHELLQSDCSKRPSGQAFSLFLDPASGGPPYLSFVVKPFFTGVKKSTGGVVTSSSAEQASNPANPALTTPIKPNGARRCGSCNPLRSSGLLS